MDNLLNKKESGWKTTTEEEKNQIFSFCNEYIDFLNKSKTEREFIANSKEMIEKQGFKDISQYNTLQSGDKVYYINKNKNIYLGIIGEENISNGLNILGSHVDSPRLDLKPNALYEDEYLGYFNTHYYGGIKKYQWVTIPLAIHGIIIKTNGEVININIGEKEEDPIFTITDLLPHLAQNQMNKTLSEGISGEDLNVLVGSMPSKTSEEKEKIKVNLLEILNEKYKIKEADFLSSELELVPAFNAKSLGLDYSMVAGYGQDDKVCAYTTLRAISNVKKPKRTVICILSDKEEIGSLGNTGMESHIFNLFISKLLQLTNQNTIDGIRETFSKSKMLSADVDSGLDPIYSSVSEKTNSSYLGYGVGINKYTGSKGKSGASDANAEYVAKIREIFETNNIKYQISELGKVDAGGGGTIAYILANKGIDVIDCGIPVLSMHAPYEVTSKYDIYMAYKAYIAFLES